MLDFQLLPDKGILIVSPREALSAEDFRRIARDVDPFIAANGKLNGLLIDAPSFPGWSDFSGMFEHMKFVFEHQRNIDRVAAVTDNPFLQMAPMFAQYFVHPEFKVFGGNDKAKALAWLEEKRQAS